MLSDQFVLVLTTFPADGDASAFARTLVLIKTTAVNVDVLQLRVKALHPYDVPEFLVFSVNSGSPDYLSWLAGETRP